MLTATYGAATSIVASCDEVHIGPLPISLTARTAVFHLRAGALGAAFIGISTSVPFAGMLTADAEPTPGGFHSATTVIGAVKPGLRFATIFSCIEPFCTSGTFGSTISME